MFRILFYLYFLIVICIINFFFFIFTYLKYTRTAEREAALIRPMAILQKTMDYLLNLLDQSYDDRFLGLYNFLWDRMRAIRMDLRMQHIFNLGAIIMLEQMVCSCLRMYFLNNQSLYNIMLFRFRGSYSYTLFKS